MRSTRLQSVLIVSCVLGLFTPAIGWSQSSNGQLNNLKAHMDAIQALAKKIPEAQRKLLSGDAQNLIHLSENWSGASATLMQAAARVRGGGGGTKGFGGGDGSGIIPVSDPSSDFLASRVTGFTQSETAAGWCGSNVVAGFNDSGSVIETFNGLLQGLSGVSFNGVSQSTDQGNTFQDLGPLNPGIDPTAILAGDPVIGCGNASTFYYSSLYQAGFFPTFVSAISVSKSTDGGATWGNPVVASGKDALTHVLDKDWMAVDPTNPNQLFVTYTDFDDSGAICGTDFFGFPIFRQAIELVASADGGSTWAAPVVLQQFCNFTASVQFSQVAVGPAGQVYVAWELFAPGSPNEAVISQSTDHGFTFSAPALVAILQPVGDPATSEFQGNFRTGADISLAVDRSGTATSGNVYVTWQDGGNLQVPSFSFFPDTYNFADVLVTRSSDGGATWSIPVVVGDNTERAAGAETDAFQPAIAVDSTGKLAVCFYDRRRDRSNFMIDRYCATSTDAGRTWANRRQTAQSWAPWHATDVQVNPFYMGDYDVTTSDFTNSTKGFIGTSQFMSSGDSVLVPNPDAVAVKIK